ncbi:MAG: hypothetical protein IID42_07730 [Planctomycetes bacterium]|nr:hypothetical protein [Planctomycetota bacterium]
MPDDISATALDWGIESDSRVWIGGHCQGAKRIVVAALIHAARPPEGPIDAGFLAPLTMDECSYFAAKIRPRLVRGRGIWVVYARGDSSHPGEFQGSLGELQIAFSGLGFCNCTQVSLGKDYVSAGFRPDASISHDAAL